MSAGLLAFRRISGQTEVFLVHPGGPYWKNRETGAWSIPKGEFLKEEPLQAAIREFIEETGQQISGRFIPLTPVFQKGGKQVLAWAVEANPDAASIQSNIIETEWPPRSGKMIEIPEVDRAAWFSFAEARNRINPAQSAFIDELEKMLSPAD